MEYKELDLELESFSKLAKDLLKRLLKKEPKSRLDAENALNHPFFM
jgi:hypothetical protein